MKAQAQVKVQNPKKSIKSNVKEGAPEILGDDTAPTDTIAASSTDEMFAFSQIIASGEKVSEITTAMEKESVKEP